MQKLNFIVDLNLTEQILRFTLIELKLTKPKTENNLIK